MYKTNKSLKRVLNALYVHRPRTPPRSVFKSFKEPPSEVSTAVQELTGSELISRRRLEDLHRIQGDLQPADERMFPTG